MTRRVSRALHFAFLLNGLSLPGLVLAQDEASALEEITVTARRLAEDLQTVPVAVSAYDGEELRARSALDLTDIGSLAPNVQVERQGNISGLSSAPSIFVRGIGQSDFIIVADPAVGVYLDGVYVGRTLGGLLDLVDVERAEVLRGPQGTLFGRNSIGGAVSLVSRKASPDRFDAQASFSVGDDAFRDFSGSVNIPLGDRSALRIASVARRRDGYVDAVQYDDLSLGEDDSWALRAQLQLEPTDTLSIGISADLSRERESPAAQTFPLIGTVGTSTVSGTQYRNTDITVFNNGGTFEGGPAPLPGVAGQSIDPSCAAQNADLNIPAPNDPDCAGPYYQGTLVSHAVWLDRDGRIVEPENELDVAGAALNIDWAVGGGTLQSITAFREFKSSFTNDMDGTPFIIFQNINDPFDQDQFSQEIQYLKSFAAARVDLTAGLYHFDEDGIESVSVYRSNAYVNSLATTGPPIIPQTPPGSRLPNPPYQFDNVRYINNRSNALYAQATWHIGERIHLTGGMRYTASSKAYDLILDFASATGDPQGHGLLEMRETSPLLSIGYDVSDDVFAYASYSTGFREGGFPARFAGGALPAQLPAYEPEYVTAYELGLKSEFFDNRLRVNAAWFLSRYEDIQVGGIPPNVPPGAILLTVINAGDTDIHGLELEVSAQVTDSLRFDASIGTLDNEFDCINTFDAAGQVTGCSEASSLLVGGHAITTENSFPRNPELMLNVGFLYRIARIAAGTVELRGNWRHEDERYFDLANLTFQEAYDVLDAGITFSSRSGRWSATLGARNLTDELYSFGNRIQEFANTTMLPARPRSLYARFDLNFGS